MGMLVSGETIRREFGADPNRPYDGQRWTFSGARGRQKVAPHCTLRDIGDLIAERYAYLASLGDIDPDALVQSILCELEREGF